MSDATDADVRTFRPTDPVFVADKQFRNNWGDQRVVVKTPAPFVAGDRPEWTDVVDSLCWDDYHQSKEKEFRVRGDSYEWVVVVDAEGVDALREAAEDAGYEFYDARERPTTDTATTLAEAAEFATAGGIDTDGDRIEVRYEMKDSGEENTYSGEVHVAGDDRLVFVDDDGKRKAVKVGQYGKVSLFCGGYSPYMGDVVSVTATAADRDEDDENGDDSDPVENVEEKVETAASLHHNDSMDITFDDALRVAGLDPEAVRKAVVEGDLSVDANLPVPA